MWVEALEQFHIVTKHFSQIKQDDQLALQLRYPFQVVRIHGRDNA
jgi:hypothetical protein